MAEKEPAVPSLMKEGVDGGSSDKNVGREGLLLRDGNNWDGVMVPSPHTSISSKYSSGVTS